MEIIAGSAALAFGIVLEPSVLKFQRKNSEKAHLISCWIPGLQNLKTTCRSRMDLKQYPKSKHAEKFEVGNAMLWIRIGFNAEPNPALSQCGYGSGSKPMRIQTDTDPDHKRIKFYMINILKESKR
jgi:hypothetical protein